MRPVSEALVKVLDLNPLGSDPGFLKTSSVNAPKCPQSQ